MTEPTAGPEAPGGRQGNGERSRGIRPSPDAPAMATMDRWALRILFDRHWGGGRWRTEFTTPDDDDLAHALAAGDLFHDITVSHDEAAAWLLRSRDAADLPAVVGGFLASLGTRSLAPRSALGSYAFAKNFPDHGWVGPGALYSVCGMPDEPRRQDRNVPSFERHKWGGVRHDHPVDAAFDLERFRRVAGSPSGRRSSAPSRPSLGRSATWIRPPGRGPSSEPCPGSCGPTGAGAKS